MSGFSSVRLVAVLFALVHFVLGVFVVGYEAGTGSCACTDDGSLASAEEAADYGSACCRAAYDFGLGVVAGVVTLLLALGAVVRLLAVGGEGEGGGKSEAGVLKGFHGGLPFGRATRARLSYRRRVDAPYVFWE